MSYENAPATKLVATHCAACGRPLVDSVSVESGMGPDCREKHGYYAEADEESRMEANQIVHAIAAQSIEASELPHALATLATLGFGKLSAKLADRIATVRVENTPDGRLAVKTPYSEETVARMRTIPGRRWDRDAKVNTFPTTSRIAIWTVLQALYPGHIGIGPRGAFTIL